MVDEAKVIKSAYVRYIKVVSSASSLANKLRAWSWFIRTRDRHCCVICKSEHKVSAHHICRKSFLPAAALQTGNGISLCSGCHQEVHRGFNRRPNMFFPMDEQHGEKIELLAELYRFLLTDAIERRLLRDDYYYLSDDILNIFQLLQGCGPETGSDAPRLEQAAKIWGQCPMVMRHAILSANGFQGNFSGVQPGEALIVIDNDIADI